MFGSAACTTVLVTVLGLIAAAGPLGKMAAVEELSSVYLYAVVSLLASRASLVDLIAAPMWVVYGFVILLVHVVLMGVLGAAVGNFCGLGMGYILQMLVK